MTNPRNDGLPTPESLSKVLSYDPATGQIRRKIGEHVKPKPVGSLVRGYLVIYVYGQKIYAHRIAWAMHYGEWPHSILDHANGERSDNRITNLRLATKIQNGQNRGKTAFNTSGFKGAYWHKKAKRWYSTGVLAGKQKYLGLYDTPQEASAAYEEFMRVNAGEFARTE